MINENYFAPRGLCKYYKQSDDWNLIDCETETKGKEFDTVVMTWACSLCDKEMKVSYRAFYVEE